MKEIIKNLKNRHFQAKFLYLVFLPLSLLSLSRKRKIKAFAIKHWDKNPKAMHRLYWVCSK